MIEHNILLNVKNEGPVQSGIAVTQGDYGKVRLVMRIKDGDAYIIDAEKVTVYFKLSNGYVVMGEAEIENGTYTYIFNGNELQSPGKVAAVVTLEYSDGRISSCGFVFHCRYHPMFDKVLDNIFESGPHIAILDKIIKEAQEQMDNLTTIIDQIKESGDSRLSEIMAALSAMVSTNGAWRNDIAYRRYSIVTITHGDDTNAYVAINDVPVGMMPPNESYWAPITLKGDTGADGAVVAVEKHYCFQIEGGHLWLYYADGEEAPNFTINDDGHLIYEISE